MTRNKIAVIYFSKDRPLQLELAINTANKMLEKEENTYINNYVLWTASQSEYRKSYLFLKNEKEDIADFVEEGDFKEDLLCLLKDSKYVLFITDDSVFVRPYCFTEMIKALSENPQTIGFSLRLGTNTVMCYPYNLPNEKPRFIEKENYENYMLFNWTKIGFGDFSYPLELSSSFYEIEKILPIIESAKYSNPNSLEWAMYIGTSLYLYTNSYPLLACYPLSRAFSIPLNKVQKVNNNRSGNNPKYSPKKLLEYYKEGYKIDPKPFIAFTPIGCHQEVELRLVKRISNEHRL